MLKVAEGRALDRDDDLVNNGSEVDWDKAINNEAPNYEHRDVKHLHLQEIVLGDLRGFTDVSKGID